MTSLADMARRLQARGGRRGSKAGGPRLPHLILMTDAERLADPEPVVARLPRGAAVILRHYGVPGREALARRLVRLCRPRGIILLVADDGRLAAAIGADGIHLPEHRVKGSDRRWSLWRRPGWLITAAAHDHRALCRAAAAGADAALLSPVFPTASHPGGGAIGVQRFALWTRHSPVSVYALGGVDSQGARRLLGSGAVGIAGIGGIIQPPPLSQEKGAARRPLPKQPVFRRVT